MRTILALLYFVVFWPLMLTGMLVGIVKLALEMGYDSALDVSQWLVAGWKGK